MSEISLSFRARASGPFSEFVEQFPWFRDRRLQTFFEDHPPQPDEFLIHFQTRGRSASMAITSERIWMLDKKQWEYVVLEFAELKELRFKGHPISTTVTALFRDGFEECYRKLNCDPVNPAIAQVAIDRCASPEGWKA